MKAMTALVLAVALFLVVFYIVIAVRADYEYSNHIASYWDLSVKASTIQQKSEYLDKFVGALEAARMADHDAVWLKTPDNDTQQNIRAIKSLQQRMHEIFAMDVNSFQYQQAISQITAQEQDDAKDLLGRLEGSWYLENHFVLWDWMGLIVTVLLIAFAGVAMIFFWMEWLG